ncbi:F0F1 ATP synthase subunit alpha, partial [Saccharothrix sp. MB29]|nr:F0F1 ATP synthase subunit alpha [Saccharothrix sp. MB29]
VSIYLGTKGHLDSIPVGDVRRFEAEFLDHLRRSHEAVLSGIRESKKLSDDAERGIVDAVNSFKQQFTASNGTSVVDVPADAMDADKVGQESVKVNRPAPTEK